MDNLIRKEIGKLDVNSFIHSNTHLLYLKGNEEYDKNSLTKRFTHAHY